MAVLVTGATGYLGSYVVSRLLKEHAQPVALLVRAKDQAEGQRRLWQSLQLHMPFSEFQRHAAQRIRLFLGDITEPGCGLDAASRAQLIACTDSVIHIAASLNRRSMRLCMNVNMRGTLEVLQLARAVRDHHGLRRFSDVSTTAVAGTRDREVVREDESIDWGRSDYDPYASTKKFCEHMLDTLLPDVPTTVFRPSTVIGDTRFGATSQFDMIRAVLTLARMRLLPLRPTARHDIVPADYVGHAIADIHQKPSPKYRIYHLSAGEGAESHADMMQSLRIQARKLPHVFLPRLETPFGWAVGALANTPRELGLSSAASLMRVFWPYVVFDTVFDNKRVIEEIGAAPTPFGRYGSRTLDFAIENDFRYPYLPWPEGQAALEAAPWPA